MWCVQRLGCDPKGKECAIHFSFALFPLPNMYTQHQAIFNPVDEGYTLHMVKQQYKKSLSPQHGITTQTTGRLFPDW